MKDLMLALFGIGRDFLAVNIRCVSWVADLPR
jgi:hypothetical protein